MADFLQCGAEADYLLPISPLQYDLQYFRVVVECQPSDSVQSHLNKMFLDTQQVAVLEYQISYQTFQRQFS
jgi:hypothetical protein